MTQHAVVVAGGGPTGLMLAGELALAGVDVAIVERRMSQDLAGSRAGGLHARTIEVLDQRGIADRFLSQGQVHQAVNFHMIPLDISDFPTRHPSLLGLWQNQIERILAEWVGELPVTIYRGRDVTGFTQDDAGVDVALRRTDDRTKALGDTVSELLGMDEPRRRLAAEMSGLGIHYHLGEGTRCSGAACPISTWSPPKGRCGSLPCCMMPGQCYSTSLSPAASTSPHGRIGFS